MKRRVELGNRGYIEVSDEGVKGMIKIPSNMAVKGGSKLVAVATATIKAGQTVIIDLAAKTATPVQDE